MADDTRADWPSLGLRQAARDRLAATIRPDEGLRERKKRLMRLQISDTATAMFLQRGFDEVRVSEVAEACGVSEKTVYNYFPTKEGLLLDREADMADAIRRVLGPGAARMSPVEAAVGVLAEEIAEFTSYGEGSGLEEMSGFRRFTEMVGRTPSLRAAQMDMMQRLVQVAAHAMADRAGVNPDDPEPQIAADALLGLWRIYFQAVQRYADGTHSPAEVGEQVMAEVRRAARLIDTGLWSFGLAVQGSNGRDQLRVAAEASNEARKQVIVAIKQARDAWRLLKAEAHDHDHDHDHEHDHRGRRRDGGPPRPARLAADEAHEALREAQRSAQQARREAQQARWEASRGRRRS